MKMHHLLNPSRRLLLAPSAILLLLLLDISSVRGAEINIGPSTAGAARQERRYDRRHLGGNQFQQQQQQQHVEYFEEGDIDKDVDEDEEYGDNTISEQPKRGLVPQLWPNYTGLAEPAAEEVSCEEAQMKCGYRAGCGLALQNYVLGCSELAKGKTKTCNAHCRHSLIALMSTHEGQRLMKCNCSDNSFCKSSKANLAQCREEVFQATKADVVVSCSAAQWICAADPQCSTALDYYNRFCGAMFTGRVCSDRCRNSIRILQRQEAAAKLETCQCDGTENFECTKIKDNMEKLCFTVDTNEVDDEKKPKSSSVRETIHKILLLVSLFVSALVNLILESFKSLDSSPVSSTTASPPPVKIKEASS